MEIKYINAICELAEVISELKTEMTWKNIQLETKDKEIARLKVELENKEGEQ